MAFRFLFHADGGDYTTPAVDDLGNALIWEGDTFVAGVDFSYVLSDWVPGKFSELVRFDGASRVRSPSATWISAAGDFTIAFWINVDSFPSSGETAVVFSIGDGESYNGNTTFEVSIDDTGTLIAVLYNATGGGGQSATFTIDPLSICEWQFFTYCRQGTTHWSSLGSTVTSNDYGLNLTRVSPLPLNLGSGQDDLGDLRHGFIGRLDDILIDDSQALFTSYTVDIPSSPFDPVSDKTCLASSVVLQTRFGTTSSKYQQIGVVPATTPKTGLGTPFRMLEGSATVGVAASWAPSTRIGSVFASTLQIGAVAALLPSTEVPQPLALSTLTGTASGVYSAGVGTPFFLASTIGIVSGIQPGFVGTPLQVIPTLQTGIPPGIRRGYFGLPEASLSGAPFVTYWTPRSTHLGKPTRLVPVAHVGATTGIFTTHLGGALADYTGMAQIGSVTGFLATVMGSPTAEYPMPKTGVVAAIAPSTRVGLPARAYEFLATAIVPAERIGQPVANTMNRTAIAGSVIGAFVFGSPTGRAAFRADARGIQGGGVGYPSAAYAQSGRIAGISSTRFGFPRTDSGMEAIDSFSIITRQSTGFFRSRIASLAVRA